MITSFWALFQGACLIACALWLLIKGRNFQHYIAWGLAVAWWFFSMVFQMIFESLTPTYPLCLLGLVIVYGYCKLSKHTKGYWPIELAYFVAFAIIWEFILESLSVENTILRLHFGAIPFYALLIWLSLHSNLRKIFNAKFTGLRDKLGGDVPSGWTEFK